ncbi:MAG: DUF4249 domain-containing protein [Carboxylicivirga sp.]|jgi:hypothetical protein|nr:DUF4249 domain-containing protein [Carboxylicivirga sp.]
MKAIFNLIGLVALLNLVSCTEEINVNLAHEPEYIVYGSMSNIKHQVTISVNQSVPVNSNETVLPVNDAQIAIYAQEEGEEPTLLSDEFMVDNGVYTSTQSIAGAEGVHYWIEVHIDADHQFVSTKEKMKKVVSIDEVDDASYSQVYVSFDDPVDDRNYYLLESEFMNKDKLFNRQFAIYNDVIFNGNKATIDVDIFFRPSNDDEGLHIVLSNINYSSYQFHLNRWKQKEDNDNNASGSNTGGDPGPLFSTPPVNLYGNIKNRVDGTRVLGNFTVQSTYVKKITH